MSEVFSLTGNSSGADVRPVEFARETERMISKSQFAVRDEIFDAVVGDLLGPAEGPDEEVVGMGIRDRYLVGQLAPRGSKIDPAEVDDSTGGGEAGGEEGQPEKDAPATTTLMPSSIGLTFAVDGSVDRVNVHASWGQYRRTKSETEITESGQAMSVWKRFPRFGTSEVSLTDGPFIRLSPDPEQPDVRVEGKIRRLDDDWVITLFLVNGQSAPEKSATDRQKEEETWLFQPEIAVTGSDGSAIIRKRPQLARAAPAEGLDREEQRTLAMQYRDCIEFAVGHGVGVHAKVDPEDPQRAREVSTRFIPSHDLPLTEPPTREEIPGLTDLVLDMKQLAEMELHALLDTLAVLPNEYAKWIDAQERRIKAGELVGHEESSRESLDLCRRALGRIQEGIAVLAADSLTHDAFRFANRAMWQQRVRSEYALRKRREESASLEEIDVARNRSWYPFQLAYLLINLPGLSDPSRPERADPTAAIADLLWFPTGGGKTEAYLGVAAVTMALRRLQGKLGGLEAGRGVAVIMRYTLRLLTIQQFQRASSLICAMEVIRREALDQGDPRWGLEPFRIGLWVGGRATPNTTDGAATAIKEAKGDSWSGGGSGTPYQLTNCPWCGREIRPGRDLYVDKTLQRTLMFCSDQLGDCEFSQAKSKKLGGLPVVVVDEEIYRLLPELLIGTVDKFAQMPWRGDVANLFGRVSKLCLRHGFIPVDSVDTGKHMKKGYLPAVELVEVGRLRPPDLIIQDELHLISGPLGSMVGLYEAAIDELSKWELDGAVVRPKVIASTATIRRAQDQVHGVFLRKVDVFPPRGLDISDNFFSRERPISPEKPGRRYFGICAPGRSRPAVLIRVYVALLTAAQDAYLKYGSAADPWMTLVGYFNALRELGGMRRLVEDDVSTRAFRVNLKKEMFRPGLSGRPIGHPQELTSRRTSADIPRILDWLEETFDPKIDEERDLARKKKENPKRKPIDVLLATNMVSVGVDVRRLGLMVVAGQPKNTAEYIQASSRVGRASPGLVCTVLNWARPRDLSHYERFEHYHATFYQYVEALSVTPFAKRALDRGLAGLLVALLRLDEASLTPNAGAQKLQRNAPYTDHAIAGLAARAWKVTDDKAVQSDVEAILKDRLDQWAYETGIPGRQLVYKTERGGTSVPLLETPTGTGLQPFTTLNSLRDVEPTVYLIKSDYGASSPEVDWSPPIEQSPS